MSSMFIAYTPHLLILKKEIKKHGITGVKEIYHKYDEQLHVAMVNKKGWVVRYYPLTNQATNSLLKVHSITEMRFVLRSLTPYPTNIENFSLWNGEL